jgi:Spy/CpxP family protein refolding chaperone
MKIQSNWKIAVGAALIAACSCAVYAQTTQDAPPADGPPAHDHWRGGPGAGIEHELTQLTRVLNLTPDQQKGVRAVLQQQGEQIREMRNKSQATADSASQTPASPEQIHAQIEQIRDESNTKITALLDENQKTTFTDWVARRKAEMEQRRQQGGPGGPPPPPGM